MLQIRRALISVSDKQGLAPFAAALHAMGVEIISTGGTARTLAEAGVPVRGVTEVTGFPEILDGRVKTLHPKIHGGLLAVADNDAHRAQLAELGIEPIDMVVVNLYPFERTVARDGVTLEEAVEQIDIGGPSMLRSAAKNFRFKAVVADPARYDEVLVEMRAHNGALTEETCARLARDVFHRTSAYDAAIAEYLDCAAAGARELFPEQMHISAHRALALRYGENPHQQAALYGTFDAHFRKLHGKELSYNNILDISAAAALITEFDEPTVAIIKHTNPCGVASGASLAEAYVRAFTIDPASAFGGIVVVNRPLDLAAAERINEVFTEVVIAPGFPDEVLALLRKKKDRRLMLALRPPSTGGLSLRSVPGGFLAQQADDAPSGQEPFRTVTRRAPTAEEERALRFAWRVAKHVKSNAIVYAAPDRALGIGAGQMSRVDSSRIAAQKAAAAGLDLHGSAVASDAFFPFPDGLLEAVRAGATAVAEPGGSVRDQDVIAAADEHGIAMVFTGMRHFRH